MTQTPRNEADHASRSLTPNAWLTRAAAAKLLSDAGIPASRQSLEFLARKRKGPNFSKILGRAVYRRCDIERWIEDQAPQSAV